MKIKKLLPLLALISTIALHTINAMQNVTRLEQLVLGPGATEKELPPELWAKIFKERGDLEELVRVHGLVDYLGSRTLKGHSGWVVSVAWSPDGTQLATGSLDHTAKIWDVTTGAEVSTLGRRYRRVVDPAADPVTWSPDGTLLAVGGHDTDARIWDVATGAEVHTLGGHHRKVYSVAWSPDGTQLATGSIGAAKIWNVATETEVGTLRSNRKAFFSVAWSPDGTQLAAGLEDNTVKIWDVTTGAEVRTLRGDRSFARFYSVAWSPDGTQLAAGSIYNVAKIWDVATGAEVHTLKGHRGKVFSVAWSPNGTRLATGSLDKTAKIWDVATGAEVHTLRGYRGEIHSVAWSPDGMLLAAGGYDTDAKIWDLRFLEMSTDWITPARVALMNLFKTSENERGISLVALASRYTDMFARYYDDTTKKYGTEIEDMLARWCPRIVILDDEVPSPLLTQPSHENLLRHVINRLQRRRLTQQQIMKELPAEFRKEKALRAIVYIFYTMPESLREALIERYKLMIKKGSKIAQRKKRQYGITDDMEVIF